MSHPIIAQHSYCSSSSSSSSSSSDSWILPVYQHQSPRRGHPLRHDHYHQLPMGSEEGEEEKSWRVEGRKRSFAPSPRFQRNYHEKHSYRGYQEEVDDESSGIEDRTAVVETREERGGRGRDIDNDHHEDDDIHVGFCGAFQIRLMQGMVHRILLRVFVCKEGLCTRIRTAPPPTHPPPPGYTYSLSEDSTLQWRNTSTTTTTDRVEGKKEKDHRVCDTCSTTSGSLSSEQEEAREMNRRWRRGF